MTELTLPSFQEAYVAEYYPCKNFGCSTGLFVSRYLQIGDIYRSLIEFDLCTPCREIPITCIIEEAYLNLWVYRNELSPSCSINLKIFSLLSDWREDMVTWNNQPEIPVNPDVIYPISSGVFGAISINVSDLVKGWHDGSITNSGILIKGDEDANNLVGFYSKDFPNNNFWPKLFIKFNCLGCVNTLYANHANIYNAVCPD